MHGGIHANPVTPQMPAMSTQTAAPNPKLVHAAHEFEAQMMQELLKPMTEDDLLTGEDDDSGLALNSGSGSGGALSDFASEALGQALSEHGGFGIADKIIRELSRHGRSLRPGTGSVTQKVTGALHGNTVMRTLK